MLRNSPEVVRPYWGGGVVCRQEECVGWAKGRGGVGLFLDTLRLGNYEDGGFANVRLKLERFDRRSSVCGCRKQHLKGDLTGFSSAAVIMI